MEAIEAVIEYRIARTPRSGSGHCPSICNVTVVAANLDEFFEGLESLEGLDAWVHTMDQLYALPDQEKLHIFDVGEEYHNIHAFREGIRNLPGVVHIGVGLCDIQGMLTPSRGVAGTCIFCGEESLPGTKLILPVVMAEPGHLPTACRGPVCEKCNTEFIIVLIGTFEEEVAQMRQVPEKLRSMFMQTTLDAMTICLEEPKEPETSYAKLLALHRKLQSIWRRYLELKGRQS